MKKIKTFIKWIFILLLLSTIILGIIIYVSSIGSYKESDFNIPKDFFETKYSDKDEVSKENWFKDLIKLVNKLEKNSKTFSTNYIRERNKCIFEKKCKKEAELEKSIKRNNFYKLKSYVYKNRQDFKNLEKKEFFKQKSEYLGINKKDISYSQIINYIRASNNLAYNYIEKWKYDLWINIILDNQKVIDHLYNNTDVDLVLWIILNTLEVKNLNAINFFNQNYKLTEDLKEKIKLVLNNKLEKELVKNSIKYEYKEYQKSLSLFSSIFVEETWKTYKKIIDKLKLYLFFSEDETVLLTKLRFYNLLSNKKFYLIDENINNHYWRKLYINEYWQEYSNIFLKEEKLFNLRKNILDSLNK